MEHNHEKIYSQIAAEYARLDGAILHEELERLEAEGAPPAPLMDEKVRKGIKAQTFARLRVPMLLAACLLLALLAPMAVIRYGFNYTALPSPPSSSPPGGAALPAPEEAPAMPYYNEDAAQPSPELEAMYSPDLIVVDNYAPQLTDPDDRIELEISTATPEGDESLPFYLPPNFSVISSEESYGTNIYHLRNNGGNNIVLTMWPATKPPPVFEILERLETDWGTVYYDSRPGYNLITFQSDGILYLLNSQYSLDVLIELCEWILLVWKH